MMSVSNSQVEKMLIGRVILAANYELQKRQLEARVEGPSYERAAILATLARQGRWASMVGRLTYEIKVER